MLIPLHLRNSLHVETYLPPLVLHETNYHCMQTNVLHEASQCMRVTTIAKFLTIPPAHLATQMSLGPFHWRNRVSLSNKKLKNRSDNESFDPPKLSILFFLPTLVCPTKFTAILGIFRLRCSMM